MTPSELANAARCIECSIPPGMQTAVIIHLLQQLADGGWAPDSLYTLTNYLNDIHGREISVGEIAGDSFGAEYLSHWMTLLKAGSVPKVLLSGDSTTLGTGITDPAYLLQNLISVQLLSRINGVVVVNAGVGGSNPQQWITDPAELTAQIAQAPDLWIIRQGLNSVGTPALTLAAIETGLQTIRASHALADSSILLMTPNVAFDPLHGRDLPYSLSIDQGLRDLARTYKCAFLDLIPLFRDQLQSALLWMDAPYANQYAVHPLEIMNVRITSAIVDFILPRPIADIVGTTRLTNPKFSVEPKAVTDLPLTYTKGWSLHRATLAQGWLIDGAVETKVETDGVWIQTNFAYASSLKAWRTGQDNSWNAWIFAPGVVGNTAPTGVTVGTTAPDKWMVVQDSTGAVFRVPAWTNH